MLDARGVHLEVVAVVRGDEAEEVGACKEAGGVDGGEVVGVGEGCVDGGFELRVVRGVEGRWERGRTPGSETRVPVVMCPRTSLPPVERLPEPMGSWGLRLGGCGVLGG